MAFGLKKKQEEQVVEGASKRQCDYDVAVLGGGHNGLLLGALLAHRGKKVVILEQNDTPGGLCRTLPMPGHPEFKFNIGAWVPGMILANPAMKELNIFERYKLEYVHANPVQTMFFPDGTYWHLYDDVEDTARELDRVTGSTHDGEAWKEFCAQYGPIMGLVMGLAFDPMPKIDQMVQLLPSGNGESIDEEGSLADLAHDFLIPANQFLDERFDSKYIKTQILKWCDSNGGFGFNSNSAIYGMNCILTANMNTLKGGAGRMTEVLAQCAQDEGAELRLGARVTDVLVKNGRAYGVRLEDGTEVTANVVASNLDPKMLFKNMVPKDEVDDRFYRRVTAIPTDIDCIVQMGLALDEAPKWSEVYKGIDDDLANKGWFVYGDDQAFVDRWQAERMMKKVPTDPMWSAMMPSAIDPSLAPKGKHTLTIGAYVSGTLEGTTWDEQKEAFADQLMESLFRCAPNLRGKVIDRWVFTPADFQRESGHEGGNIFGVDHRGLSAMMMFRPLPELSDDTTPIKGLYLCGASQPPMGGVSGTGGWNCANKIMEDYEAGVI